METQTGDYYIEHEKAKAFQKKLLAWHKDINRELPWREKPDPYSILVSEVMLHQTFAKKVIPVYNEFMRRYPTIFDLAKADLEELEKIIYTLGLNYRAKILKRIAEEVVGKFNGVIPNTKKELLGLPSVGEYTSSAILSFAYNKDEAIVDTNVIRVIDRVFGFPIMEKRNSPGKKIINLANGLVAHNKSKQYNLAVLDFASLICTHYNPKCDNCFLRDLCIYFKEKNTTPK